MKLLFFKHAGKKLKSGKKIIVLVAMVALLFVTGFVNLKLSKKSTTTSSTEVVTTSSASFFASYRADRTETRNREIDILEAIIASPTSTTEAKNTANEKRMNLLATMEKELVLEGLIKSAGFDDAVVTTTTENYNVIVKNNGTELSSADANKILDIVVTETKCKASNVKVMSID